MTNLIDEAKRYYDRGWNVLPAMAAQKRPAGSWKQFQDERIRWRQIAWRIRNFDNADSIAVVGGKTSGMLAVRDFDNEAGYREWVDKNQLLAKELPTVKTRRGTHVFSTTPIEAFDDDLLSPGEYRADSKHITIIPPTPLADRQWIIPLTRRQPPLVEPVVFGAKPKNQPTPTPCISQPSLVTGVSKTTKLKKPKALPYTGTFESTLPLGEGQRNQKLFHLVLHLKLLCATPQEAERRVREWHQLALPFIGTKDWETTWQEFCRAWVNVTYAWSNNRWLWSKILSLAASRKVLGETAEESIWRLCATMQEVFGPDSDWYLSGQQAGDYAEVDQTYANLVLRVFVQKGLLEMTEEYVKNKRPRKYRILKERNTC